MNIEKRIRKIFGIEFVMSMSFKEMNEKDKKQKQQKQKTRNQK